MKLHHRFLVPVLAITVVASLAMFFWIDHLVMRSAGRFRDERVRAKVAEIAASQRLIEQRCLATAGMFTRLPVVQQAYALALTGDMTLENDPTVASARALLKEHLTAAGVGYVAATGEKNLQLHFHLPTGRSLWRLWQPGQTRSDDLTSFRQTVVAINRGDHKPIAGVEVGVGGFVIRGLAAIQFDDGRHAGSVEAMAPYDALVLAAKGNDSQSLGVFMHTAHLPIAKDLQDAQRHPRVGDEYVLTASTDAKLICAQVDADALARAAAGEVTFDRGAYHITAFPVMDHSGKSIGVVTFMQDQREWNACIAAMRWSVAGGSAALVVILVITTTLVGRHVARRVQDIVSHLAAGTDRMSQTSGQIAAAAQNVAGGAAAQASSLDEVSNTLTQMTAASRENATRADRAQATSSQACRAASEGNQTLSELNSAMAAISDSAGQIERIIKVIQEIAFQTNLLALNAAVEAARAGEHGRGFAVVAEEVRGLAIRAGQAASETTELIANSVSRARSGAQVASATGAVLHTIVQDTHVVGAILGEITAATADQAHGVERTSASVSTIDRITQQNAASAEELASAAQELSGQSEAVKHVVGALSRLVAGAAASPDNRGP